MSGRELQDRLVGERQVAIGHGLGAADDADAGRGEDRLAHDRERLPQAGRDALCDAGCVLRTAGILQQHDELVAGQASRHVLASQATAQAAGDPHQQLVAGGVSQAVIHVLELVQVKQQHGNRRPAAVSTAQGCLQHVQELGSVRQARQRIVEGLVGKPALKLLALTDVAAVQHHPLHARLVDQVGDRRLQRQPAAGRVLDAPFDRPGPAPLLGRCLQQVHHLRCVVGMQH
jgi:hypothetical protein